MTWQIFYNASLIFNVLAEGIICLFLILTVSQKDPAVRGVTLLSFGLSFWAFFYFLAQVSADAETSFHFFQLALVGLILVPPSFMDETASLIGAFSKPWIRLLRYIIYAFCSSFILLTISDLLTGTRFVISNSFMEAGGTPLFGLNYWGSRGLFFDVFLGYFLVSLVGIYALFWFGLPKVKSIKKTQLAWIFWSSMITGSAGSTQFLLFYGINFPPIGAALIPIYVFGLFYAITRFHLFNSKVVTAELFTIGIWAILIVRMFFARTSTDLLIDGVVLFLSIVFGVLSIRSIINEVDQKDRLEDLNVHLNQKVMEQTAEIRTAYEVEKKARIELEALDKAKDQFILTTQHHLRTPITIVKGFLDMALFKEEKLSSEGKTYLQKAFDAAQNMANLVNDLLTASQMRVNASSLNPQKIHLEEILNEIGNELKSQVEAKKLSYSLSFTEKAMESSVVVDRKTMKSALYNFIDNAIKYTKKGGITITGDLVMHPIEKIHMMRVTIKDTGIGVEAEDIQKIFNHSFERGEEARKVNATGKGIGLVLSKNIIQSHGGKVVVTSEGKDKGTQFTIELPAI